MIKRIYVIATFILVAMALMYVLFLGSKSQKGGVTPRDTKKAAYIQPYRFDLHEISTYRLHVEQNSSVYMSNATNVPYVIGFDAYFHFKVKEALPDHTFFALVSISEIVFTHHFAAREIEKELKTLYQKLFVIKFTQEGRIVKLYFAGKSENYQGLSQLLTMLEVINKPSKYYEEEQYDTNGNYKAVYTKRGSNLNKKREKYYTKNVKLFENHLNATIDRDANWLKSLTLEEHFQVTQNSIRIRNRNYVSMKKVDFKSNTLEIYTENKPIAAYLTLYQKLDKTDGNFWQELQRKNSIAQMKQSHVGFSQIMQTIIEKPSDFNRFHALANYLIAYPDQISKIKEAFPQYTDFIQMHIVATLAYVNTPQANQLLRDIASDESYSEQNSVRAIIGLGSTESNLNETLSSLESIINSTDSEDKKSTSFLAIGRIANATQDSDAIEMLRGFYQQRSTLSEQKSLLYSIKSAGVDHFIDEVKEELGSDSKNIRILALQVISSSKNSDLKKEILLEQRKKETDKKIIAIIDTLLEDH